MAEKLIVHRKTYTRKAHERKSYVKDVERGPGVRRKRIGATKVKASRVPATTYETEDRGAPGRGQKIIEIKKGGMEGYSTTMSLTERHEKLDLLVSKYGVAKVWKQLQAMIVMRKRTGGAEVFIADQNWLEKTYGTEELTPKTAIRKWKSMSHKARVKARA